MGYRYWLAIGSSIILGLIFLVAGVGKIANQTGLVAILVETSIVPSKLVGLVAHRLPWIELALGLCLIVGISAKFMASASCLLVIGFIVHNTWIIEHGLEIDSCECWGEIGRQTGIVMSSEMARYIDIGMLALIFFILLWYPGKFFTIRPWFSIQRTINSGGNKGGAV